jgi:hypothetical protein
MLEPDGFRCWRPIPERAVWSYPVVLPSPSFCQYLDFLDRVENLAVHEQLWCLRFRELIRHL